MRKYNISAKLVRTIEQLYDKADDIDALAEEEQELARSSSRKSRQNLHKVLDGGQCGEDQRN